MTNFTREYSKIAPQTNEINNFAFNLTVSDLFARAGVKGLSHPPNSVLYNVREGTMTVHASAHDLDLIQTAINTTDASRPIVNITGRFVEVDAIRDTSGHIRAVNTDFTDALRNVLTNNTSFPSNPPDFMMGTLSEKQMTTVLAALQHSKKAALLCEGQVTTYTGRQAQFSVADMTTIVDGVKSVVSNNQSHYDYTTTKYPLGTALDLVPRVSADQESIALTVIPSVTALLGYENPKAFFKEHKEFSQYNYPGVTWPMPKIRIREARAKATVADGETLLLANLSDDTVTARPDGSILRQKYSDKPCKELLVFATATIVDKNGNRVHPDSRAGEISQR